MRAHIVAVCVGYEAAARRTALSPPLSLDRVWPQETAANTTLGKKQPDAHRTAIDVFFVASSSRLVKIRVDASNSASRERSNALPPR